MQSGFIICIRSRRLGRTLRQNGGITDFACRGDSLLLKFPVWFFVIVIIGLQVLWLLLKELVVIFLITNLKCRRSVN